jgi:hypothetical protein
MKISTLPLLVSAVALAPVMSYADDPCAHLKTEVALIARNMHVSAAYKRAANGHFTVRRVPLDKNISATNFQIAYLVNGKVVYDTNHPPTDDGDLEIHAAGKRLFYDESYGAGGSIKCHFVIVLQDGETKYSQIK